jgi:hypothetical protein
MFWLTFCWYLLQFNVFHTPSIMMSDGNLLLLCMLFVESLESEVHYVFILCVLHTVIRLLKRCLLHGNGSINKWCITCNNKKLSVFSVVCAEDI